MKPTDPITHFQYHPVGCTGKNVGTTRKIFRKTNSPILLTFSSTVFLILAPASLTFAPALLTAEYRKLPNDFAPATALVVTVEQKLQ